MISSKGWILFWGLLALILSVGALQSETEASTTARGVIELTPQNWNNYVNGSKAVFVKFFAPWCGHCQNLVPHFAKLAEHFQGNNDIIIAEANADRYREFIHKHGLRGYPTLKFFPKGKTTGEEANCGHSYDSMRIYLETKLRQRR